MNEGLIEELLDLMPRHRRPKGKILLDTLWEEAYQDGYNDGYDDGHFDGQEGVYLNE